MQPAACLCYDSVSVTLPAPHTSMKLLIEDDEGHRTVVPVIRDEITIGRRESHSVRLTERNVSRDHARIVRDDDQLFVEDVDARYGVFLNGSQIDDRAPFNKGDVVQIGDYRLTLRPEDVQPGEDSAGEAASPDSVVTRPQPKVGGDPDEETSESHPDDGEAVGALTVISNHDPGRTFELDSDALLIGRSEECDIVLNHRSVSSRHARVVREGEDYRIIDLDSSNGVKVDGERYRSMPLEPGDIIGLGHVELRFVGPDESWQFAASNLRDEAAGPESAEMPAAEAEAGESDRDRGLVVLGVFGIVLVAVVAVVAIRMHDPAQPDEASSESATSMETESDRQRSAERSNVAGTDAGTEESGQAESAPTEPASAESTRPGTSPPDVGPARLAASESLSEAEAPSETSAASDAREPTDALEPIESTESVPERRAEPPPSEPEDDPAARSDEPTADRVARADDSPTEPADRGDEPASDPQPTEQTSDAGSGESAEQEPAPESLFQSATRKWVQGNAKGAIEDCSRALETGYTPCYRVIGMAQKQRGNTPEACRHFEEYVATEPDDAPKIRRQMEELGCSTTGAE